MIEFIPFGKENKIVDFELVKKAELRSEQELKNKIEELRENYIIFSKKTNSGKYFYWRPNSKEELQEFIKKYQSRSYDTSKRIMIAYKELEEMEGKQL